MLTAAEILELQRIVRRGARLGPRHPLRPGAGAADARPRAGRARSSSRTRSAWGAGPRAVQFLDPRGEGPGACWHGRTHVTCEDIQALAKPVLRHRLVLSFTAESEGVTPDQLIDRILSITPTREDELTARCTIPERFLHPEAIKRIARLDLRARHVVEGFLSGMHRSPYFGQSVEFRQHRQYTYGDDLRYVDWKVWAKQDRYYVKQFEEDTNLRGTLLVDVSGSMRYGRGPMNKYEYGCTVAASLAYLLLAAAGRRRLRRPSTSASASTVPLRTRRNHLDSIIQALEVSQPARQDRPVPDPSRGGRDVSAPRNDGVDFRPAGRARRACSAG